MRRSSVRAICLTRMRSARFSRGVSTSLAGSAKHRENTRVSATRLDYPYTYTTFPKDPYHTYLSIAAAAIVSPDPKWELQPLDPLINATHDTVRWAKTHVRGTG